MNRQINRPVALDKVGIVSIIGASYSQELVALRGQERNAARSFWESGPDSLQPGTSNNLNRNPETKTNSAPGTVSPYEFS